MPNRIIREGILTSETVNSLSWAEEVFYRRLLSVVDDFGRYYASPKLLRAACYPLHIDKVSDSDIGKWLSACETAALVRVYPALDGKRYLQVLRFNQQVRAKESKFPQPMESDERMHSTCIADAKHLQSNAHLDVDEDVDVSRGKADRFDDFWNAWPKSERKQDKAKCQAKWKSEKLDSVAELILADVEVKKQTRKWQDEGGKFIEAPLVYINNRRWEDGVEPAIPKTNGILAGAI